MFRKGRRRKETQGDARRHMETQGDARGHKVMQGDTWRRKETLADARLRWREGQQGRKEQYER